MHHHNQSTHRHSSFMTRHLALLVTAIIILGSLYLLSQNLATTTVGAIVLVLVHVVAVVGVLVGGRAMLGRLVRRLHGTSHTHDDLATEGVTISWARFYDVVVRFLLLGQQAQFIQSILDLTNIHPGEKVLDVGCGTGTLAIATKQQCQETAEIHGLDAAPEMIELARQKANRAHVNVDFQHGLAEAIPFPDNSFDLVMNSLMVHHLPGDLKARAFREMYRVLKPGGRLLIVDFEPPKEGIYKTLLTLILGQMTTIDNTVIPPLLREAGFENIKTGPTGSRLSTCMAGVKPAE